MNTYDLSKRFIVFANRECRASSQLYEHLAKHIAHDKDLLEIAAHSQPGQPVPNLLLGSVHYLLLNGIEHELAAYYASMTETPLQPSGAIHFFRDFCIRHRSLLIYLLKSKSSNQRSAQMCIFVSQFLQSVRYCPEASFLDRDRNKRRSSTGVGSIQLFVFIDS